MTRVSPLNRGDAPISTTETVLQVNAASPLVLGDAPTGLSKTGHTPKARSERVAIGEAMEKELQGRVGNPNLQSPIQENFPELQKGQTRDLVAKATGFGPH